MNETELTAVELLGVTKVYADGTKAVDALNLKIVPGEFVVMVGPSGCGKSTTLRMLAGLEEVSDGEIVIDGEAVNDLGPGERDIAMVFQDYALYPHMTVAENIGFSLRIAKVPKKERNKRIAEAARVLELTGYLNRKPGRLSGGQRQRVAMGRAIVRRPKLFLLDEPLSNLDAKLRVQMRAEILEIQERLGITTFYVTHDQVEAMTMADRVAVINQGVLQQFGPPHEIFDAPDNVFVAAFMGSPAMNLMEAKLLKDGEGGYLAEAGSARIGVPSSVFAARPSLADYIGRTVIVGIRPKDLEFVGNGDEPGAARFTGPVRGIEILGFETILYLGVDATPAAAATEIFQGLLEDDQVAERIATASNRTRSETRLAARVAADLRPRAGEQVTVAVKSSRLHFFDSVTGRAIRS